MRPGYFPIWEADRFRSFALEKGKWKLAGTKVPVYPVFVFFELLKYRCSNTVVSG